MTDDEARQLTDLGLNGCSVERLENLSEGSVKIVTDDMDYLTALQVEHDRLHPRLQDTVARFEKVLAQ